MRLFPSAVRCGPTSRRANTSQVSGRYFETAVPFHKDSWSRETNAPHKPSPPLLGAGVFEFDNFGKGGRPVDDSRRTRRLCLGRTRRLCLARRDASGRTDESSRLMAAG